MAIQPFRDPESEESEVESLNPFQKQAAAPIATVQADSQRAVSETQSAMVIAQRFPRNQVAAMDRILQAFTRQTLAETALYSYARGGTDITGPSIRAAETIAQNWGNIQFGVRELEQRPGESTVEAFAWDIETNTRSTKVFQIAHVRHTKQGQKRLEDPRDIYELVANNGARRLRACILSVIPGDVVEAAITQAETTLKTRVKITPEMLASLAEKFEKFGVDKRALEARIQRRLDSITPALVVQLGKIYNSLQDGMSSPGDWFDLAPPATGDAASAATRAEEIKAKLKAAAGAKAAETKAPDAKPAETKAADAKPEGGRLL